MTRYIIIVASLCILHGQFLARDISTSENGGTFSSTRASVPVDMRPEFSNGSSAQSAAVHSGPIIIYYGLNESHSRSWVRKNRDGVIGVSYFQRHAGSYEEGTLVYKTIQPGGLENLDSVAFGRRLEKSVLLYDSAASPHIFVASSDTTDQIIVHHSLDDSSQWQADTIIHFHNEGGKYIYELSGDTGPDHSFHLVILKTRSDIDSDDFMDAWIDSYLLHMTNESGIWATEVIANYDMAYTYDMYVKSSSRQDIKVDDDGYVHLVFSRQIQGTDDPSQLLYASNKSGFWRSEVALNYDPGSRDDAGWFPSLCLDNDGIPYISCMYIDRVYTYSATYCHLLLLRQLGDNSWQTEVIADRDDGYYGGDGRDYTGGLTHLVFDAGNRPHIIFSDIASTHYPAPVNQVLAVGNIRYGVLGDEGWDFTTIYRQPLPTSFLNATEMHGMCLVLSEDTDSIRVIGEELVITGEDQYTSRMVDIEWAPTATDVEEDQGSTLPDRLSLSQNYPNPFNPGTEIGFSLPTASQVKIEVFNINGQKVATLADAPFDAGTHSVSWDAPDAASGVYLYRIEVGDFTDTRKMILLK